MQGYINEVCPATWQWGSQTPVCEYVFHGQQSAYTCCPHGLTIRGHAPESCGCRDDLAETPYRMAYTSESSDGVTTTFNFKIAAIDPMQSLVRIEHADIPQQTACLQELSARL